MRLFSAERTGDSVVETKKIMRFFKVWMNVSQACRKSKLSARAALGGEFTDGRVNYLRKWWINP